MGSEHEQPGSVVTLLLTDVERSSHLLHTLGDRFADVLGRHERIVRQALARHRGRELEGTGDRHAAVFARALDAAAAAVEIQQTLAREPWPAGVSVRARIGLHSGELAVQDGRYLGLDAQRAARIRAAAHGGQVLLSASTRALLDGARLPAGSIARDLGSQRLPGLHYPETLFELAIPRLPDRFPPPRSLDPRPHDLPASPTAFVGRSQRVADVVALLLRDDTRLVTLTGAAGSGKTRISLQVAAGLFDAFPDGVFHVALAPRTDRALVGPTIATALAVPQLPGSSALDRLIHQLAGKRALLVLDHLEHDGGGSALLAELLTACAQLKAIVTSRAALGLRLEREHEVPPMQLARGAGAPDGEAVQLFVTRARAFQPDFALTGASRAAIAEICARLAGLPLAIELAAARMKTLTPAAILAGLAGRLERSSSTVPEAVAAHVALRATIAWSYDLLDAESKALFRRAAVFAGGFDSEAAEHVLALDGDRRKRAADVLQSLVDHGLLVADEAGGEPRLRVLEGVREYALEQLAACGEDAAARAAHAAHFLALGERCAPELMGMRQRACVQRLLNESDNLRAAFAFTLDSGDVARAARMIGALLWLWIPRGLFDEGRTWVERALQRIASSSKTRERALILAASGWLAIFSGDYAGALGHCEQARSLMEQAGTDADVARAKLALGVVAAVRGRVPDGPQLLYEALAMYRELGDPYGTALALIALGECARACGDERRAAECFAEALSLLRASGNVYWPGQLLQALAQFRLHEGDWKGACALLAEALDLGREYDYPRVVTLYVAAMGGVALARGRALEGAQLFGAVSAAQQLLGASFESNDQQELERQMASTRGALGDEAFEHAFAEGSHWSLDQAVAATLPLRS